MADYQYYRSVISRIRRPSVRITYRERKSDELSLETYMSYGLGSSANGRTVSQLLCSNDRASEGRCTDPGLMACSRVC
jgi:hypothetical protein